MAITDDPYIGELTQYLANIDPQSIRKSMGVSTALAGSGPAGQRLAGPMMKQNADLLEQGTKAGNAMLEQAGPLARARAALESAQAERTKAPTYGMNMFTGQRYAVHPGIGPDWVNKNGGGRTPVLPSALGEEEEGTIGQPEPVPPPGTKFGDAYNKLATEFRHDMDAAKAKGGAFAQAGQSLAAVQRLVPLLSAKNPDGSPRQLTSVEWNEVATQFQRLLMGGVPRAQQLIEETKPKSLKGDIGQFWSWFTSAPYAPDQQEWIDRFMSNINREHQVALNQVHNEQLKTLPTHGAYFNMFPNRAKQDALSLIGKDAPKYVDQVRKGTYRPPAEEAGTSSGQSSSSKPDIRTRAMQLRDAGKSKEEAADILKSEGYAL